MHVKPQIWTWYGLNTRFDAVRRARHAARAPPLLALLLSRRCCRGAAAPHAPPLSWCLLNPSTCFPGPRSGGGSTSSRCRWVSERRCCRLAALCCARGCCVLLRTAAIGAWPSGVLVRRNALALTPLSLHHYHNLQASSSPSSSRCCGPTPAPPSRTMWCAREHRGTTKACTQQQQPSYPPYLRINTGANTMHQTPCTAMHPPTHTHTQPK